LRRLGGGALSAAMTDQSTSLSPAALRDIIANIDKSLEVFARNPERLHASEVQTRQMLLSLRERIATQLENHPEFED
jgi:hypothetical protein